jgi:cholesterol transport system auxiliary component
MSDADQISTPDRRVALSSLVAAIAVGVAGCGTPAPSTYDLTAARAGAGRALGGRAGLIIAEPAAVFALDSERIVVRTGTGELTYLPRAQWSDRLPRLVQARIVQSFENTGRAAVARPTDRIAGRLTLITDLRAFEIREQSREAYVEVAAKLATSGNGQIVAARVFVGSASVGSIDGPGASAALDAAQRQMTQALVAWANTVS